MNMNNVTVYDYMDDDFNAQTDPIYTLAYQDSKTGHLFIRKYSDLEKARNGMRMLCLYPQKNRPAINIRLLRNTVEFASETLVYIDQF